MTASHPFNPRPPLHHQGTGSPTGHAQHHNHHHVHHNHNPYNASHNQHHPYHNNNEAPSHHQYHNPHTQIHDGNNGDDGDHYYNNHIHTVHEYDQPTDESPHPSALWLLNHPSVNRELQRMAVRLVERQRRTDDPGVSPCLFVVLPKTSRGLFSASASASAGAQSYPSPSPSPSAAAGSAARANDRGREERDGEGDDYWLYFLCDFMMPENTGPMLHVCSPPLYPIPPPSHPHPSSFAQRGHPKYADPHPVTSGTRTRTYPGGYQLRDLDEFVAIHALPMLGLLYLVDQANTHGDDAEWTDRIRGGIRFLAERCKEDLADIYEEDTQVSPSPEMDPESERSGFRDGRDRDGEGEDEGEESEDEEIEEEEDQGDEEAECELMRLREDDFRDPWRVAGKYPTSSHSSSSSVDGINFDNLDLNRHSHDATPKPEQDQEDYSGSAAGASSGGALILGADVLCQVNHPFIAGGILWLCEAHNEMLCKGMAAEKLRQFIKSKQGNCIPMEKSAEIQLHDREDARVFYRMLDEYKCVIKLKIGLDWVGGATEEDLWELCWAMHSSTVRDLTVDCGGGGESFRPMLGMMCRLGFVALTIENYVGTFLSPAEPLVTHSTASRRGNRSNSTSNHSNNESDHPRINIRTSPFSLVDFRASPSIMSLPDNIQLKKLTFRHWARVPDRRAIVNLVQVLPNLTELETMTDSVERMCEAILDELQVQAHTGSEVLSNNSQHYHHPFSHLNLLEVGPFGSKAEFTFSKPSGPEGNIRILETHWKTNQPPRGQRLLQQAIRLETLEFTQCVGLWEMGPELQRIVGCNYSTLRRVEIVCTTERMADVWVFLRREFMQPTMALGSPGGSSAGSSATGSSSSPVDTIGSHRRRVSGGSDNSSSHHQHQYRPRHRSPVHLLIYDRAGHVLESPNAEQYDQTTLSLDQYDHSFRPQLELQSQIANRLRIGSSLTDLTQLNRLSQDVGDIALRAHQGGSVLYLRELIVYLTRETFEDVGFLEAIWELMGEMHGLQSLTIQLHNDNNTKQGLIKSNQKVQRPQDAMPRRLLEAFRRLGRIELGPYWTERFERWMQELLIQEMLPIRTGVAFPPGLPVQGGFVFGAGESLLWTEGGSGCEGAGGAEVVYSLTFYRP